MVRHNPFVVAADEQVATNTAHLGPVRATWKFARPDNRVADCGRDGKLKFLTSRLFRCAALPPVRPYSDVSSSEYKPLPKMWGARARKPTFRDSLARDHVEKLLSAATQQKRVTLSEQTLSASVDARSIEPIVCSA